MTATLLSCMECRFAQWQGKQGLCRRHPPQFMGLMANRVTGGTPQQFWGYPLITEGSACGDGEYKLSVEGGVLQRPPLPP